MNYINAPNYVSNHTVHSDLKMSSVYDEAKSYYKRFRLRVLNHLNQLSRNHATQTIPDNPPRKLKRKLYGDPLET